MRPIETFFVSALVHVANQYLIFGVSYELPQMGATANQNCGLACNVHKKWHVHVIVNGYIL